MCHVYRYSVDAQVRRLVRPPFVTVSEVTSGVCASSDGRHLARTSVDPYRILTVPGLDLEQGQTARRSRTLTAEHVTTYAQLSGDYNPLHFDASFAAGTPFGRLVVQGGLTTGLLHALVATDMPGPGTVFLSQNWRFTAPVFVGDTITAEAVVESVHESKPVCRLSVRVSRSDGETVLEGEAWCYTFQPSDAGVVG